MLRLSPQKIDQIQQSMEVFIPREGRMRLTEEMLPQAESILAHEPEGEDFDLMLTSLGRIYTSLNAQLGVICHVLQYPPFQDQWPDSVPLEVFGRSAAATTVTKAW